GGFNIPLEMGKIVSNEPGYYKTGEYGIRIENLVVVTDRTPSNAEQSMLGFETITLAPIDRHLILVDLLTQWEKEWLNKYHQKVYDTLSPFMDDNERAWLKDSTAAL